MIMIDAATMIIKIFLLIHPFFSCICVGWCAGDPGNPLFPPSERSSEQTGGGGKGKAGNEDWRRIL